MSMGQLIFPVDEQMDLHNKYAEDKFAQEFVCARLSLLEMINGGTIDNWCLNFSRMCPDELHRFFMDLTHMCNLSPMAVSVINPELKLNATNHQEVLNELVKFLLPSCKYNSYVTVSRSFFSTTFDHRGDIGDGLECCRGYHQSMCPSQMGLSLNIDISATSLYKPVSVIKFVEEFMGACDTSHPLSDRDCLELKKALRGVRIETPCRQDQIRRYKITGITPMSMGQLIFPVNEQGTRKTVMQHFLDKYDYRLKYGSWPCLHAGSDSRAVYFPTKVAINLESKSRATDQEVLHVLIKLDGKLPANYEGKSLYTAASLPFESEEVVVMLLDREQDKERAEREYKITITCRADSYHLQQFLHGRQRDMPQETVVVLRESPSFNYVTVLRSFFSTTFGHRGDIDISATSFFKPVSVIIFVEELMSNCDTSIALSYRDHVHLKKAFRGVRIGTTHRQDQIRRYKITGITPMSVGKLTFPVDNQGTRKTAMQYFFDKYNYILKYGLWPCLRAGSNSRAVYFPTEIKNWCVILLFVSLSLTQCANGNTDEEYCKQLGSRILGSCPGEVATGDCCPSIIYLMDTGRAHSCLCWLLKSEPIKNLGLTLRTIIELYYDCNGKQPRVQFTDFCNGNASLPAYSPPSSASAPLPVPSSPASIAVPSPSPVHSSPASIAVPSLPSDSPPGFWHVLSSWISHHWWWVVCFLLLIVLMSLAFWIISLWRRIKRDINNASRAIELMSTRPARPSLVRERVRRRNEREDLLVLKANRKITKTYSRRGKKQREEWVRRESDALLGDYV